MHKKCIHMILKRKKVKTVTSGTPGLVSSNTHCLKLNFHMCTFKENPFGLCVFDDNFRVILASPKCAPHPFSELTVITSLGVFLNMKLSCTVDK